jgi:hypothetical protein
MNNEKQMMKVLAPEVVEALLVYLKTKPYGEVDTFVTILRNTPTLPITFTPTQPTAKEPDGESKEN